MKRLIKTYLINLFALWLVSKVIAGFVVEGGMQTLLIAGLVLSLVNTLVKPIINILLLPINLITLGTFRWIVNVASLYVVAFFVPRLQITGYQFTGFNYQGFIVPQAVLITPVVYVVSSLLISLVVSFFAWLTS